MKSNPQAIRTIISVIKRNRRKWQLSPRDKNARMLSTLTMTQAMVFNTIYARLEWRDYVDGPLTDNHILPRPGQIWIFGFNLEGYLCYLKFQERLPQAVVWISIHEAQFPIDFPYRVRK